MATASAVATSTITQEWTSTPNQAAHLCVNSGIATPNDATFVSATTAAKTNEYGGFDFSAIPVGSTINEIRVRQRAKGTTDGPNEPGLTFGLKVVATEKVAASYNVNTDDEIVVTSAAFAPSGITCDDLRAGLLRVRTTTFLVGAGGGPKEEPIPQG